MPPGQEPGTVLAIVGAGGLGGFESWYRDNYGRLVSVLVRLGVGRDDASDLATDAFSRALQRWDSVSAMPSPTGWLFTVAFNLMRRQARRGRLERLAWTRGTSVPVPEPVPVWDAVAKLPHRQRTAVVLHYLLDLSYEEIAATMGVGQGTVAATLSAARQGLAKVLGDEEIDHG